MAQNNTITIELGLEIRDALKELKEFKGQMTSTGSVIKGILGADVIKAGFGALVNAFKEGVAQATEYEDALNQLNFALASSGQFSSEASKGFEQFAQSIQDTTKFSDDAVLSAAALIENISHLDKDALKQATTSALDLSAALGIDLDTAARLVGKAADGNVDSFKRFGIEIKKGATDAETFANTLKALSQFQGAAAAQGFTFSGALAIAGNSFNDFQKSLGELITKTPGVIAAIRLAGETFKALGGFIEKNNEVLKIFITNYLRGILGAVAAVVDGLKSLAEAFGVSTKSLDDISLGLAQATVDFESFAEKAKKGSSKAFDDLSASAKRGREQSEEELKKLKESISRLASGGKGIGTFIVEISPVFKSAASSFLSDIGPMAAQTAAGFAGALAAAFEGSAGASKAISGLAAGIADAFLPGIGAAVGPIFDALAKGPEFVKEQIKAFFDEIPNVIKNIIEALPELLISVLEGLVELGAELPQIILDAFLNVLDRLPEFADRIANVLVKAAENPAVSEGFAIAVIRAAPHIAIALASVMPLVAQSFVEELIKEAPRFVDELINSINPFSGGGGGGGVGSTIGGIGGLLVGGPIGAAVGAGLGKLFGFAEGGRVPNLSQFQNDGMIARLSGGEQVLSKDLSDKIERALTNEGPGQPIQINLVIAEEQFARVNFNLKRQGFRMG